MSNRLTRIYTRTGDQGTTALANGTRISKTSPRIEVLGTVDELNSSIGLIISGLQNDDPIHPVLTLIQHQLFDLGGEIAVADHSYTVIDQTEIEYLECQIDKLNAELPRSICRRAERQITALLMDDGEQVNPHTVAYLNRLSDLLFVASRTIVLRQGGKEILWQPRDKR